MGRKPTPDPGEFVSGIECAHCTDVIPLFLPGQTPATIFFTRYGHVSDPTTWALPQIAACEWELNTPAIRLFWTVFQAMTGFTYVHIYHNELGIWRKTFEYFHAPGCQTNVPNWEPIWPIGTYAIMTW